jgi:uncharacterized protein
MNDQTSELNCMKCGGAVRTYKRNGITIDQCTACHGIFLDRGELERLISAESAFLGAAGAVSTAKTARAMQPPMRARELDQIPRA